MNLDYATVFSLAPYINENLITIIGICLLIGAMAKSSQVGLHVWLPMAMPLLSQMITVLYERHYSSFIGSIELIGTFGIIGLMSISRRINSLSCYLRTSYAFFVITLPFFYFLYIFITRRAKKIALPSPNYHTTTVIKRINHTHNKSLIESPSLTRQYSTLIRTTKTIDRADFFEWFRGFTDGEGCFHIGKNKGYAFRFFFQIKLHIDDRKVLEFIQEYLGIGGVNLSKNEATFVVSSKKEVKLIIDIFSQYSLNTTKYLNFLDFKKAFELYTNPNSLSRSDLNKEINLIKCGMNSKRFDLEMPKSHQIRITRYWLLGFVEGDGSFTLVKINKYSLRFDISQSSKDLSLMVEIKNYLNRLPGELDSSKDYGDVVSLAINKTPERLPYDMLNITIKGSLYITNVLIPFFDSMVWLTKKELDYQDWKVVLKLRQLGLHYTSAGLKVIEQIFSQINNNRLSTAPLNLINEGKKSSVVDKILIQKDIDRLLTGPSNLEIREGDRVWIKSLNKFYSGGKIRLELIDEKGLMLYSFDSVSSCSDFLGVSRKTVMKKLVENKAVLLDNKVMYIKKVLED